MKEKIKNYILDWELKCYKDGIPDEIPVRLEQLNKAPSYKQICKALLKNDINLKSLGFSSKKSKYYQFFKKIEIEARNKNKKINMNVYEESQLRLKKIFEDFDNIYVSFSGGKDSGVLLNLCIDYIRKNNLNRKIGVFHIDYEAQYQMTTDYVDSVYLENSDVLDYYRICLPISAQCSTSMTQSYWIPWDVEMKDFWVRHLPKESVNESNHTFDFFEKGMWDYDFQLKFSNWIHKKNNAKKTACLVGIRTQESLHRWKAIHIERTNGSNYENTNYSTKVFKDVYNMYPIYDWITEDIWRANSKFNWTYNRLYDIFYQAGLTLNQMRVASPFNNCAQESLKLYKIIDPKNWGKMIGRVNGVNFTGLYGGTTAMGWHSIRLPENHTWKSYMEFLLKTLPSELSDNYKKKLQTSIKYWKNKGSEVSTDTIKDLISLGLELDIGPINEKTGRQKVRLEYQDDLNIKEFRLLPSYKRMCVCIMKNDHCCKYMGFGLTKHEWLLRKSAENKYKKIKL